MGRAASEGETHLRALTQLWPSVPRLSFRCEALELSLPERRWAKESLGALLWWSEYCNDVFEESGISLESDADKKEKERKEAEKQQEIYDRIDSLMQISPELANAYVHAIKAGNVI